MTFIVVVFGALTALVGLAMLVKPAAVLLPLKAHIDKPGLYIAAIVVRAVLGTLMVLVADTATYPLAIKVIGWLAIVAALGLVLIGHERFKRLISWAVSLPNLYGRGGGCVAFCFGAFIVHAMT